jgi:hypothetical protein
VAHITPSCTCHRQWLVPSLVPTIEEICVQMSVAKRWQLASCLHLLGTGCQPSASLGGPKRWKSLSHALPAWLVTDYSAMAQGPYSPQLNPFLFLWTLYESLGWQGICKGYQHSASYHLMPTETRQKFLLCQCTSHRATVRQALKCQWPLCTGLMCTMCYHCARHTRQSQNKLASLREFSKPPF